LRSFPLDKLKIDRSFVRELPGSRENAAIANAVVSLAHSLDLHVIAEGVETQAQLDYLRKIGCDQYQGYLCSAAVTAEALPAVIREHRRMPKSEPFDPITTMSGLFDGPKAAP
jgi:diguanylate cyclase